MLVPLLLDMRKVYEFLSNIFITEFENAIISWITFGCLYAGGIYFYSSAKAKVLKAIDPIQTSELMILLNSKKP